MLNALIGIQPSAQSVILKNWLNKRSYEATILVFSITLLQSKWLQMIQVLPEISISSQLFDYLGFFPVQFYFIFPRPSILKALSESAQTLSQICLAFYSR
jgi:hypothetical protein